MDALQPQNGLSLQQDQEGPSQTKSLPSSGYWTISQFLAREAEQQGKPAENPVCPQCHGLKIVKDLSAADRENTGVHSYPLGRLVPCPICNLPAQQRWLARNCGLEGSLLHARLADWQVGAWKDRERIKQRAIARKAIEQATAKRHGLYTFYGDFGSGKTHALAVACNELREQRTETFYAPMASILAHLRSLYGTKQDTSTFWQRLLDIPVLALDEVTRINTTDWAREMLFVLVDTRYVRRASHLTLFATNNNPRQSLPTTETFGYLFSRMRQGKVIELRGDMREVVT